MYLKQFRFAGIKCFDDVTLDFPIDESGSFAGWNVLLGANATGKSTLLQAMGIALVGPNAWPQLLTPKGWVRRGVPDHGTIHATITKGPDDMADRAQKGPFKPQIAVMPDKSVEYAGVPYDTPQFVLAGKDRNQVLKSVYAIKKRGWFACGYGPFRRLSGGNNDVVARLTNPRQWRMASLFDESVALVRCEPWLLELHHKANDPDRVERVRYADALDRLKAIINSLLPGQVRIDRVDSARAHFVTGSNTPIALSELSDGYRSFLALVIDLLRHIFEEHEDSAGTGAEDPWKSSGGAVEVEGVVLIDEIDAHLHPTWQRRIGHMLRKVFPRMQFIVSTHSPFVAQAASNGGLFMLRTTDQRDAAATPADAVQVVQPVTSVRGWRAERILTSDLFGMTETVDVETEALLTRYHTLAGKAAFNKLPAEELRELHGLETQLGHLLTAPGESSEEFRLREESEKYIKNTLAKVRRTAS
ncbi:MAG: AAA family ATPase [Polyangiaceae bacterium]|nr:AAA family ATPase [Polyangiaceae bacterium]